MKSDARRKSGPSQMMIERGQLARMAARRLAVAETGQKNAALFALSDILIEDAKTLLAANARDLSSGRERGLDAALMDRLELTPPRIEAMASGVREIAELPDPVGEVFDMKTRPSGIQVGRMRVPLGVVGIIYESRPNVTADAAALCLKSGNACILRGGSEALNSNQAIARCIDRALRSVGLPTDAVQVIDITDREVVGDLLSMPQYVDVVIPRGGKSLVAFVSDNARVPVIKHLDGICHVYIDSAADVEKALAVAVNAKTQRLGTCNTMETLLVDRTLAAAILPELERIYIEHGIELRGCEQTRRIIGSARPATAQDWDTEYLGPMYWYATNLLRTHRLLGGESRLPFGRQALSLMRAFTTRFNPTDEGHFFATFDISSGEPLFDRIEEGWQLTPQSSTGELASGVVGLRAPISPNTDTNFQREFTARLARVVRICGAAYACSERQSPSFRKGKDMGRDDTKLRSHVTTHMAFIFGHAFG